MSYDMTLCHQVMQEIRTEMEEKRPQLKGEFSTYRYDIRKRDAIVGYLDVSYYSPYYFNESDFRFLDSLNRILIGIGLVVLTAAVAMGTMLAKRLSVPLLNVAEVTRKIAKGDYKARLQTERAQTQEVENLSRSVNEMAESLERQEKLRRRLTSDVAHELRTPVTNVSLNLEMMLDGVWDPTKERLQNCYGELAVGKPGLQIKIGDGRENHALVSQRQLHGFFSPHPSKSTPARKKQSAIPDLPYTPAPSESS